MLSPTGRDSNDGVALVPRKEVRKGSVTATTLLVQTQLCPLEKGHVTAWQLRDTTWRACYFRDVVIQAASTEVTSVLTA